MPETGTLRKMKVKWDGTAHYAMNLNGEGAFNVNQFISKPFTLFWTGNIYCINCGKAIKKTFGQGFCYQCFTESSQAAPCIIRPELCEAHLGKGRNVAWENEHHNQPHLVYLAQTSGIKVGVTRGGNIPTRWLDQGAANAVIIAEVPYRKLAGDMELELRQYISDRTDWRQMLTHVEDDTDLSTFRTELLSFLPKSMDQYALPENNVQHFEYPVPAYPERVTSLKLVDLSQEPRILLGIRGQYLYFEKGKVINLRKYSGYEVTAGQ